MTVNVIIAVWAGLFGLAIGSFLNVVVARVPAGQSVVSPRSRCGSCETPIASRDNIPVASFLLLRGRCRACASRISLRYPLIEILTSAVFVSLVLSLHADWRVPPYLCLAGLGIALAAIDVDTHRLPNALTYPAFVAGAGLLLVPAVADGAWHDYARAWIGAVTLGGLYLILALAYPAGMGLGDVKLACVLGLYLGFLGWDVLAVGAFAAFLLGAVASCGVLLSRRGTRKTAIPFGPFMLAGALCAIVVGSNLASVYTGAI